MSYRDIRRALVQSLVTLNPVGATVVYDNKFKDTSGLASFLSAYLIPADTEVISKDSLDEESGIFQISVYTRSDVSTSTSDILADLIQGYYKHGVSLVSNAQKVFIDRTSRGGGRNSNGWFIVDLSIYYTADLSR